LQRFIALPPIIAILLSHRRATFVVDVLQRALCLSVSSHRI
jgi:hypothetical protein